MKKLIIASLATLSFAPSAHAADLLLALGIDGSGSITPSEFALQKNAYANVLADSSVLPLDNSVAIAVYLFAANVQTVFPLTEINSSTISSLIAAISGMSQPLGGTNIAGTIQQAAADLTGSSITSNRQIIDISTDGEETVNSLGYLNSRRNAAIAAGIDQINCIGIGSGARCRDVIAGSGAFTVNATSFASFETALGRKIHTEVTGGAVPEPATWAMMILGFGLVGGAMRRNRQRATVRFAF